MVQINVAKAGDSCIPKPLHNPVLGSFIYLLSAMAVVGAFLFGYDTGIVSAAMLYLKDDDDMYMNSNIWQEIIVSVTPGFAGIGSLLAGPCSDKFGRKKVIVFSTIIFASGAIVCGAAFNRIILLVGRMLLGIAIGIASTLAPLYVSECAPTHIRGRLITCFQLMLTFGLMAANIIAGGFSYIDPTKVGWRLMFGFAAVPAIIQFIGFLFLPESPRWLYENVGEAESEEVLKKIYNNDSAWIEYEIEEIKQSHEAQVKAIAENGGNGFVLGRILTTPHIRKALLLGCALQMFQQLSGINTIMYYTGTIIKSAGVKDDQTTIWISVGTSGVNFLCTFLPFLIIEKAGRRIILLASMFGLIIALCLMGGAFLAINKDSAKTESTWLMPNSNTLENTSKLVHCSKFSNCDFCVTDDSCGFCAKTNQHSIGFCLPLPKEGSNINSTQGICATNATKDGMHYLPNGTEYEWADVFCHTNFTIYPIIIMVLYLVSFSTGLGPAPWILNAEFYPLWSRATCVAIATATNWFFNLLISLTFLTLTSALTKFGTFFFYAALTLLGIIIFYFTVPETKDKSLDEVEALFMDRKTFQRKRNAGTISSMISEKIILS